MTVLGASGFIGRRLTAALRRRGDHVVTSSVRDPAVAAAASDGSDVVVNLAGAPVSVRWTEAAKSAIRTSRVDATRAYLEALKGIARRPAAYVAGSAVGYYGTSETATFTEPSPPGDDFLARVCVEWEAAASGARELGMRTAIVRTGVVLGLDGGVLGKLLHTFRLGLGGPIASGRQWCSWIHADDETGILVHAIDGAEGVLNGTAPQPVTNAAFTEALARAVHRPALLPLPAFVGRALFGEGAQLLNEGQRVLPDRTVATGYVFAHPNLDDALASLLARPA
ncbi:MAG TPA: TIGR01777 family oxidoreductase [Candidatus Elarobacter sp.]|nr:TIGR01777 family oxidoreductase [Candidatus Elarobacter sp.]